MPVEYILEVPVTLLIYLTLNDVEYNRRCGHFCHTICILGVSDTHVISLNIEVQRGLIRILLLMLAGDIESNPGPCKFHTNHAYRYSDYTWLQGDSVEYSTLCSWY